MTARASSLIAKSAPPHVSSRAQKIAAAAAALLCVWTVYADPLARERALALAAPLLAAAGAGEPEIKFGEVGARRAVIDGQTILYVEGSLRNVGGLALKAPALRVALIGDDGRPLYAWTAKPAKARLEADEDSEFRTRLLSPPASFKSIAVSAAPER